MTKMENIIIVNPEKFERVKMAIKADGPDKLYVLSDFDGTLIKYFVNGKWVPSLAFILYNNLESDYACQAQKLHDKYYTIERDPKVPIKEKKEAMREWWAKHFDLLIKYGLTKKDIENIVNSELVQMREGFPEFNDLLYKNSIPLIVISSGGQGGDAIPKILNKGGGLYNNTRVISNFYNWDEGGKAMSVKLPMIIGMHKDEIPFSNFPEAMSLVKNRRNIILLGDSLDDIDMVTGFENDNIIKIGFLNKNVDENLKNYKKTFDVLILNDGTMDYINELLKELIK
jgi:cytosolic 5'-nucleotidase 3